MPLRVLVLLPFLWGWTTSTIAQESCEKTCVKILMADRLSLPTQSVSREIFDAVFSGTKFQASFLTSSNRRALRSVQSGEADIYLFKSQVYQQGIFPGGIPLGQTYLQVISLDTSIPLESLNSQAFVGAGVRGDGLGFLMKQVKEFINVDSYQQAVDLLQKGRVDFFLDYETEIKSQLLAAGADAERFVIRNLRGPVPLFPIFHVGEKGQALNQIYMEWMQRSLKSGALLAILRKHGRENAFPAAFVAKK